MYAGQTVMALDAIPPETALDSTSQTNLTNTEWQPGDPDLTLTFMAPTSGLVWLIVGGGLRDNGGSNRILVAPQVRLHDQDGLIVVAPGAAANSWTSAAVQGGFQYGTRMVPVPSLIPGETYWAQLLQSVSGGSTADINNRQLLVIPH